MTHGHAVSGGAVFSSKKRLWGEGPSQMCGQKHIRELSNAAESLLACSFSVILTAFYVNISLWLQTAVKLHAGIYQALIT